MYSHGADLRGNVAYANTKIQRKWYLNFYSTTLVIFLADHYYSYCLLFNIIWVQ